MPIRTSMVEGGGASLGNILQGVAIGPNFEFQGHWLVFINPYSLMVGITTLALFSMHGAIYLVMKTEGELQARVTSWINKTIIVFIVFYAILTFHIMLVEKR